MRKLLRQTIDRMREESVRKLIQLLRNAPRGDEETPHLHAFADQIDSALPTPDLLRELFRAAIMEPEKPEQPSVKALRGFLGWKTAAPDFCDLRPELLEVVYLLPPRDNAILETLVPIAEFKPSDLFIPPEGSTRTGLLDVGTGTGLLLEILRASGLKGTMLGIDPAEKLCAFAHQRFLGGTVQLGITKIEDFKREGRLFQAVLCYMVLHHVADANDDQQYRNALRIIFDSMEEGGLFAYTDKLCESLQDPGVPLPFDFKSPEYPLVLKSGQELQVHPTELNVVRSFQPHPKSVPEFHRTWTHCAEILSQTGFLIELAKPLNQSVFLFVCRKPHVERWSRFSDNSSPCFVEALAPRKPSEEKRNHPPYQWSLECLKALYEDISGYPCPKDPEEHIQPLGFLRGIAYFSWEPASRLFLVRRAVPFDFHILSYSHVHEGWGSLGRMVVEFERNPEKYTSEQGYSCLTRDVYQRTLPFLGDMEKLGYEAAMAVPVHSASPSKLRGAFLLYLAKREYLPLHTGSSLQWGLAKQFKRLNELMNEALDFQERSLKVENSARTICEEWEKLVQQGQKNVIIAKLDLDLTSTLTPTFKCDPLTLLRLCSRIQALLSGSEYFSVLDDRMINSGRASILVAARFGLAFEDTKKKILSVVGTAAENCQPLTYKCDQFRASSPKLDDHIPPE